MTLAIKTDQDPVSIYLLKDDKVVAKKSWQAGYQLSQTLLKEILGLIKKQGQKLEDIEGLITYKGPGGFTSLRLGVLTANTLAYSYDVPVVGSTGKDWLADGSAKLKDTKKGEYLIPEYGRPPNITQQKK